MLGGVVLSVSDAVSVYVSLIEYVIPFVAVFLLGDLCVSTILRAAFGGRLTFRSID